MAEAEVINVRVDELPERWGCDLIGALEDAIRHDLIVCTHARAWPIEWGRWLRSGTMEDVSVGGALQVRSRLAGEQEANWDRHLSPRQMTGPVALGCPSP